MYRQHFSTPIVYRQRGVVLIVALIMLVVISMLAATGLRNSSSTEAVSSAVRANNLALQAAEVALRFCENDVRDGTATVTIQSTGGGIQWQDLTRWDGPTSLNTVYVVPQATVNQTDLLDTYRRFPECMVEVLPTSDTTVAYVITARGFGPEVSAVDADRTRPQGSEAWLQTTFQLEDDSGGGGGGGTDDDDDAGGDENKSD